MTGAVPVGALIVVAVFGGAFIAGLVLIRRQRRDGRRSKFPPIG